MDLWPPRQSPDYTLNTLAAVAEPPLDAEATGRCTNASN